MLVTILLLYAMWVDDPVREDIPIVTCSGSSLLIEGSLLGLLLWRGAWCRRLSVKRRAALCVVAWLLTVTSLVVFISLTE